MKSSEDMVSSTWKYLLYINGQLSARSTTSCVADLQVLAPTLLGARYSQLHRAVNTTTIYMVNGNKALVAWR